MTDEIPSDDQSSTAEDIDARASGGAHGSPKAGGELEHSTPLPDPIHAAYQKVEVPLRYDSEFFHTLSLELSGLHDLQTREKSELTKEICRLGQEIAKLAAPPEGFAKTDLNSWRKVFSLYTEFEIFFSTNERDKFRRDSSTAQKQLQKFSAKLSELKLASRFSRKESHNALERFLFINLRLLRNLKFQELNSTAMTKILKSKSPSPVFCDSRF